MTAHKYNDKAAIPNDCKTIFDIIKRQGDSILMDCLAEAVGDFCIKHNLSKSDRLVLVNGLVAEFTNALNKRT